MMFRPTASVGVMGVVLLCLCTASSSLPAATLGTFFQEDFDSAAPNPFLEGYGAFTFVDGALRTSRASNGNDRRYMRTVAANYNTLDFVYEVTFTTTHQSNTSINFIGIGHGDRRGGSTYAHNEPYQSLFFRIHTPNVAGGYITVSNSPANDTALVGSIPTAGTHRSRIEKHGDRITFSIDAHYDGTFAADMSHTFEDITSAAPFLTDTDSHLFFGTAFPVDRFDDLRIVPEPSTLALLAVGVFGLATYGWRRRKRSSR